MFINAEGQGMYDHLGEKYADLLSGRVHMEPEVEKYLSA